MNPLILPVILDSKSHMKKSLNITFFFSFWILIANPCFTQAAPNISHFGLGLNYGGVQLDWRPNLRWMFEVRGQQGSDTAEIKTTSSVIGARAYRYLRAEKRISPYFGMELAHVKAKQKETSWSGSGISLAGFGGISLKLSSRFTMEFDMGPYLVSLNEKSTNAVQTEVDFVGDAALIFFF